MEDLPVTGGRSCAAVCGYNVHAGVCVAARNRLRLEHLCRYAGRPPLAAERLRPLPDGRLLYRLRHHWRDGTTHVIFEPLDLVARLEVPPYELSAPQHLIANLTVKGSHRVLHLMNWTGNKLEKNRMKEYYLAPVEDVRVLLRVPEGKHLRNVRTLVPGTLRVRNLGRSVEVRLPRIDAYQGIAYTVED